MERLARLDASTTWPPLPLEPWRDTRETLHLWTQVVGKVRLALAPHVNHWWQVALYVTPRGLTTSSMPLDRGLLQMDFDLVDHRLHIERSDGAARTVALRPRSVADFHAAVMDELRVLDVPVSIWTTPVEVPERIPFEEDERHASYDPDAAERLHQVLAQAHSVLSRFRARFRGKASPVHFFWGGFDLAATRFSGRPAPPHPGAPNLARFVVQEAYTDEVSSAGWWPSDARFPEPAFYAYAYPEPDGFRDARVRPEQARYEAALGEFILPYEDVRRARRPEEALLAFLEDTYAAAADLGGWDRDRLEGAGPAGAAGAPPRGP